MWHHCKRKKSFFLANCIRPHYIECRQRKADDLMINDSLYSPLCAFAQRVHKTTGKTCFVFWQPSTSMNTKLLTIKWPINHSKMNWFWKKVHFSDSAVACVLISNRRDLHRKLVRVLNWSIPQASENQEEVHYVCAEWILNSLVYGLMTSLVTMIHCPRVFK